MKNLRNILTVLTVAMMMLFSSNLSAQTPDVVYDNQSAADAGLYDDDYINGVFDFGLSNWQSVDYSAGAGVGIDLNQVNFVAIGATYTIVKAFNGISNMDDITITYSNQIGGGEHTVDIYLSTDDITYTALSVVSNINNIDNTVHSLFIDNIENGYWNVGSDEVVYIKYVLTVDAFGIAPASSVTLDYFNVEGTLNTTLSINENYLADNLEIYSHNKSVFLTYNENANANVTVYTMSGQVVKTESMNLSTSKSELNLYDVNSGMYIIMVNDGTLATSKKVYIQ